MNNITEIKLEDFLKLNESNLAYWFVKINDFNYFITCSPRDMVSELCIQYDAEDQATEGEEVIGNPAVVPKKYDIFLPVQITKSFDPFHPLFEVFGAPDVQKYDINGLPTICLAWEKINHNGSIAPTGEQNFDKVVNYLKINKYSFALIAGTTFHGMGRKFYKNNINAFRDYNFIVFDRGK